MFSLQQAYHEGESGAIVCDPRSADLGAQRGLAVSAWVGMNVRVYNLGTVPS